MKLAAITDTDWSFPGMPEGPDWQLDWAGLVGNHAFLQAMADCPQSPLFHGEGDVQIHTGMVCEALVADPEWRALAPEARGILFAAALLHDVAKPVRTKTDETTGNIVSPGHSVTGAHMARELLYRGDGDIASPSVAVREQVCTLVRWHGLPLNWDDRLSAEKDVLAISLTVPPRWLAMLARADVNGRECPDKAGLLERVELFATWCDELGCLEQPRSFANEFTRYAYFSRDTLSPDAVLHDDTRFTVTLLSGLPGAGKDTWLERHGDGREVVSLDAIRRARRIAPEKPQGLVVAAAKEAARELLRRETPFVWNATNITETLRQPLVTLFANYHARVEIVYVESPYARLQSQNRTRSHPVASPVLEKLMRKWSVPTPREAHGLLIEATPAP